jgi:DNA-binding transcriptional ArsR family regulator
VSDDKKKEDRDQQLLRRLTNIEHKVDSLDQTTAFSLRANAQEHYASVRKIFGRSKRRVQVYLAANGNRSVDEISELLSMSAPNVSRELSILEEEGLLEVQEIEGGRTYWGKKAIDRTIRISRHLKEEFEFGDDGLPV